jgi:hypothetical protein
LLWPSRAGFSALKHGEPAPPPAPRTPVLVVAGGDIVTIIWKQMRPDPDDVWNAAATTEILGVVFLGGGDGILHALSATDGHTLWEYDSAREFTTVNQLKAKAARFAVWE